MRPFRFLLVALALALASAATAPFAHAQVIPKFGLAGGLNFGSLSDATAIDLDQSTGYHVGIFGDVGFGPLAARISVLYVKAGDAQISVGGGTASGGNTSVTFIAVPVDFKFRFPSPVVKPYALLGPEARFPVGDLTDFSGSRSTTLALNFGVGAELSAIVGPSVFAELRYGLDVTGFVDGGELPGGVGTFDSNDSFKVNAFFLRIGVAL